MSPWAWRIRGANGFLCDAKPLNEVQGFTPVCPAQKSILSMATTATEEKKVKIFNRVKSPALQISGFQVPGREELDVGWTYWHCYCCICAVT